MNYTYTYHHFCTSVVLLPSYICQPTPLIYLAAHGMEYGFGAHEYPTSGVFQVEPKSCPGFIFRRSVCVGTTDMSPSQVRTCIEDLAEDYHGDTYHLIVKNCNHFTADVCQRLTGKPVPGWVNRLARLGYYSSTTDTLIISCLLLPHMLILCCVGTAGSFFNCVLPESIKVSAVRGVNPHPDFSGTVPASLFNCLFVRSHHMVAFEFKLTEPIYAILSKLVLPPIRCCCERHCLSGCVQLIEDSMNYL